MKKKLLLFPALIVFVLMFSACSTNSGTKISGTIDYVGDADFYIELSPLHYKYSPKNTIILEVNNGAFSTTVDIESPTIAWLVLQDIKYPVYLESNTDLEIEIKRAQFPLDVTINGSDVAWNGSYQKYLKEIAGVDAAITIEMDKFKVGQRNTALAYSKMKLESAQTHLVNTPLEALYHKVIGENLVLKLRAVEYSSRFISSFDTDAERAKVVKEANDHGFFELDILEAQRAGIRDFTHYYSRTFGIYDNTMREFGEVLAEYDIKQVAYHVLDEKRMQVINQIENRDAKAYAELFIVAERIGEQPFEISEPTYNAYLAEYPEYSSYIEFLTAFYTEIKSVSPGQPAIPFTIYDRAGEAHNLEKYAGKFVLLDFWAGWCQPCLAEFPHMREIYASYSRDDFEILGISTEVDSLVWIQDITRFENPWVQLYGGDGTEQETFKAYKGGGIPFYILVDPAGNISRYNDIRPSFNFTEVLDSLLENYNN